MAINYLTCEELYNNLVEKCNRTIQIAIDDCFFLSETLSVFIHKLKGRNYDVILRQITNKLGKPITNDTYTDIRKNAKKYLTRTFGRGKHDFGVRITIPKNDKIVEWFMTQTYAMLSMEHMSSPLSVQYRQALLAHKKTGPVDDCHKCGEHPYQCECEVEDDEEACCECDRPARSCWCREIMYDHDTNTHGYFVNNEWIVQNSDDEDSDDEDSDDEDDNVPIAKLIEERRHENTPIAKLIEDRIQQQAKPVVVYTGRKVLVNLKTKTVREI